MGEYSPTFIKFPHARECSGDLYRLPNTVFVDRIGRIGNGGIVAHDYVCNRSWAGCGARVLVTERAVRALAVTALIGGDQ